MPLTQDSQTTFKPNLTTILASARARYIISNPDGRPCSMYLNFIIMLYQPHFCSFYNVFTIKTLVNTFKTSIVIKWFVNPLLY